ncbi:MAG: eL32 family ribosomal protein [archaeon]
MSKEFKRQEFMVHSKLGKNRKKLQKWRKPKGRDSKMRLKRKSYPKTVSIGYSSPKTKDPKPVLIHNIKDLLTTNKNTPIILARVGAKKKIEIIKLAQEKKIKILNIKGDKK